MPKPSYEQQEALYEFLQEHTQLAKGRLYTQDAKRKSSILWRKISDTLNAMGGGAVKPPEGKLSWAKYWVDKKAYLKKVTASRNTSVRLTGGGGPSDEHKLSDLDKKFLMILGEGFGQGDGAAIDPFYCGTAGDEPAEVNFGQAAEVRIEDMEILTIESPIREAVAELEFTAPATKMPRKNAPKSISGRTVMVRSRMEEERLWIRTMEKRRLKNENRRLALQEKRFQWEQEERDRQMKWEQEERDRQMKLENERWEKLTAAIEKKFDTLIETVKNMHR